MSEKIEQKSLLQEVAEKNGEIIYQENKVLAKLSWLRSWSKNPRIAEKKDLSKLENQIENLGVYKPLVITIEGDNGIILGGNMRYKVLSELRKKYASQNSNKYEYVWVSIVNPENEMEKLKYALSDNFSAGKYSREKLREIIKADQLSLLPDYQLEFSESKEIDEFINELGKTDDELKSEGLAKQLKAAGVDGDMIDDILEATNYGKVKSNFNPQKLIGTGALEFKDKKIFVMKLVFTDENEELYKELLSVYSNAAKLFQESQGELYKRIISVYGKGMGDVLIKSLHLLSSLPTSEEFRNWQLEYKKAEEIKEKQTEDLEGFFESGRETLL